MTLHSDRRASFFLAALAATSVLAGCTHDSDSNNEPILGEQRAEASKPPAAAAADDDDSGGGETTVRALSGKVIDEEGRAVGGALVMVSGMELGSEVAATTDATGAFTLDLAPRADLALDVIADGYETASVPVSAEQGEVSAMVRFAVIPWPPPAVKKGLTWVKALHDNAKGQDQVSCHDYTVIGGPPSATPTRSCNPYVGDTACNLARPILCLKVDGSGSNGHVWNFYNGWAKGNIGITHPIVGTTMLSLAVANAQCVAEFGAGWRMASHHDGNYGGGWQWRAYGNLNTLYAVQQPGHTLDHRFWVYILEGSNVSPWNPSNPPNSPTQLAKDGGVSAQANAGNCWN